MPEVRSAPFFIGDDPALDFLNSVAAPSGREIDWLANGGDFIAWLEQAHAVPADIAAHFRKTAGPRALDAVAAQARELREWFRTFVREHAGKPLRERRSARQRQPRQPRCGQVCAHHAARST